MDRKDPILEWVSHLLFQRKWVATFVLHIKAMCNAFALHDYN